MDDESGIPSSEWCVVFFFFFLFSLSLDRWDVAPINGWVPQLFILAACRQDNVHNGFVLRVPRAAPLTFPFPLAP